MDSRSLGSHKSCRSCSRPLDLFGRCRRKSCPKFGPIWADDWYQVLLRNLAGLTHTMMFTITAPGVAEGLVWDRSKCSHPPDERCSGPKGCKVVAPAAEWWNRTASARLAKLHRAAYARVRRELGPGPLKGAQVWEEQQRGVKHVHIVLDYRPGRARQRADAYMAAIEERAPKYLWGSVDQSGRFDQRGGIRAAAYLAKYVSKATTENVGMTRPVYVGQHLTSETGVTMRFCRMKRYCWHLAKTLPIDPELAAWALLEGRPLADVIGTAQVVDVLDLDQPPPRCSAAATT